MTEAVPISGISTKVGNLGALSGKKHCHSDPFHFDVVSDTRFWSADHWKSHAIFHKVILDSPIGTQTP